MNVRRCTLEVLHRAVDLLPHRSVSRPSFCSQILVNLTAIVLLELQWLGRMSLYTGSSPQRRISSTSSLCQQAMFLLPDSGGSESPTGTPVAQWTYVAVRLKFSTGPLIFSFTRCVSRPSFCPQILVGVAVPSGRMSLYTERSPQIVDLPHPLCQQATFVTEVQLKMVCRGG